MKYGLMQILKGMALGILLWVAAIPWAWMNGDSSVSSFNGTMTMRVNYSDENITSRRYNLYIPPNHQNQGVPLIIALHGGNGNMTEVLGINTDGTDNLSEKKPFKTFLNLADYERFVVVIPNGTDNATNYNWNDGRTEDTGNWASQNNVPDVMFLHNLVDNLTATYPYLSANKVYITGTSNGGMMAMRMAQAYPNKFAAIAICAANKPDPDQQGYPRSDIPVLMMHGNSDPIMPYNGGTVSGSLGTVKSAADTVTYWKTINNLLGTSPLNVICDNGPFDDNCSASYSVWAAYSGTSDNATVEYTINGGGHAPPSVLQQYDNATRKLVNNQCWDIEFAHEAWNFMQDKGASGLITPYPPLWYRPATYQVLAGTRNSGAIEQIDYQDAQYMSFGSSSSPAIECTYHITTVNPNSFFLKVVSKDSLSSDNVRRLFLWNFNTNQWDLKDQSYVGTNFSVGQVTVNSPAAYLCDNVAKLKIVHARTDSTSHDMIIDLATIEADTQ